MKNKVTAWLLLGSLVLGSVAGVQAEELLSSGDSLPAAVEQSEQTAEPVLLNPDTEESVPEESALITEAPAPEASNPQAPETAPGEEQPASTDTQDLLSDGLAVLPEEDLLAEVGTANTDTAAAPITVGKAVNASGKVRPTDVTVPSEKNVLVGVTGTFSRKENEIQQAIKLINQYRKEACNNQYPNPSDPSMTLTSKDYRPISWSAGLEWIAQTRAAEASYTMGHVRPDGDSNWGCEYLDADYWYENLSWNNGSLLTALKEWYSKKDAWISQDDSEPMEYYAALIDPDVEAVGFGCYKPDRDVVGKKWTTIAGIFGNKGETADAQAAPVVGKITQTIQIPRDSLTVDITMPDLLMEKQTAQASIGSPTATIDSYYGDNAQEVTFPCSFLQTPVWSSSDASVAKVTNSGKITANKDGTANVIVTIGAYQVSSKVNVWGTPVLIGAYNGADNLGVKFYVNPAVKEYVIYRKYNGVWKKINTVKNANSDLLQITGNTAMYRDRTVKDNYGAGYIYSVAAKIGSKISSYKMQGAAIYRLKDPTIKSAAALSNGKVKIVWGAVPSNGYEVQYQEIGTSKWVKCKHVSGTSQTITGLKKGKSYQFRVRSYKTNKNRGTFYSSFSKYKKVTAK